jgi:hypothetical protein
MAEKSIADAIKSAVKDLTQLEVVTMVGPVSVKANDTGKIVADIAPDTETKAMVTRIDLIDGDIRNLVDPVFVTGDLQSVRDFHNEQVKKGNDIIVRNIEAVADLAKKIETLFP